MLSKTKYTQTLQKPIEAETWAVQIKQNRGYLRDLQRNIGGD